MGIRYRNDVIEEGIRLAKSSKTTKQLLDNFDVFINGDACKMYVSKILLKRGDLLILSNNELLHARDSFLDTNRHLLRARFDIA